MAYNLRSPESFQDFSGFVLDDTLELVEAIRSGTCSTVYKAVDLTSPPDARIYYAIKCLAKPEPKTREELHQRREFGLHRQVSAHPNIVNVHRVLYTSSYVFLVMDWCKGGDLFTAITETDVFHHNDDLVRAVFLQLIDAVHYCHQSGVFHRDLKTENVLCLKDCSAIYLTDFGSATHVRKSGECGWSKSFYASPECAANKRYRTLQNDVWALGVILVNMITGRNPWHRAIPADPDFGAYLRDESFLYKSLPISLEASDVLSRIFKMDPRKRISLPSLRKRIVSVETFFMREPPSVSPAPSYTTTTTSYFDYDRSEWSSGPPPYLAVSSSSPTTSSDSALSEEEEQKTSCVPSFLSTSRIFRSYPPSPPPPPPAESPDLDLDDEHVCIIDPEVHHDDRGSLWDTLDTPAVGAGVSKKKSISESLRLRNVADSTMMTSFRNSTRSLRRPSLPHLEIPHVPRFATRSLSRLPMLSPSSS